jgi:hypothetical protein
VASDPPRSARFDAPWDGTLRIATAAVFLALAGAAALLLATGQHLAAIHPGWAIRLVPLAFLAVPILLAWAAAQGAPRGFLVDDDAVRVERRSGPLAIPLASIRHLRVLDPPVAFRREGGIGGFLGHVGEYRDPLLGRVRLLATRSDRQVLLETEAGAYVLTPASPERFVAEVRARLGRAEVVTPARETPPGGRGSASA